MKPKVKGVWKGGAIGPVGWDALDPGLGRVELGWDWKTGDWLEGPGRVGAEPALLGARVKPTVWVGKSVGTEPVKLKGTKYCRKGGAWAWAGPSGDRL